MICYLCDAPAELRSSGGQRLCVRCAAEYAPEALGRAIAGAPAAPEPELPPMLTLTVAAPAPSPPPADLGPHGERVIRLCTVDDPPKVGDLVRATLTGVGRAYGQVTFADAGILRAGAIDRAPSPPGWWIWDLSAPTGELHVIEFPV